MIMVMIIIVIIVIIMIIVLRKNKNKTLLQVTWLKKIVKVGGLFFLLFKICGENFISIWNIKYDDKIKDNLYNIL